MDPFSLEAVKASAEQGRVAEWVQDFLHGPGDNKALADGLRKAPRWWRGPLVMPLPLLERCCGPEPEMEFWQDPSTWEKQVSGIADFLSSGGEVPALIAEYRSGRLSLRDGSHRLEALREVGAPAAWVLTWYNSRADFDEHGRALGDAGTDK